MTMKMERAEQYEAEAAAYEAEAAKAATVSGAVFWLDEANRLRTLAGRLRGNHG